MPAVEILDPRKCCGYREGVGQGREREQGICSFPRKKDILCSGLVMGSINSKENNPKGL